jgi:hypothetical protein
MHAYARQFGPLVAMLLLPLAGLGQEGASPAPISPADDIGVVNVQGLRNPEIKSYRNMLKGNAVLQRFHALAPQASLKYVLLAREPGQSMEGVTLRIAGADLSVPVELDKDARFSLPEIAQLADADAELILNRKRSSVTWRPDVRSPGVPAGFRRLGDLRLECEVRWAVEYDDIIFVQRQAFNVLGGPCGSSLVNTHFLSPRRLKSVVLHSGDKEVAVTVARNGWSFIPPLHDKALSDDTLLELRYDGS